MKILLIEDNAEDVRILRDALAAEPALTFELQHADQLSAGLAALDQTTPDVVLLDLGLPDSHGLETLIAVHEHAPRVPIVILTASDDEGLALQALQRGAQDYLVKGYVQIYRKLLGRSIRYAIERERADAQLRQAYAQTEQLLAVLPSILIGVNPEGLVTHWNAVAELTFGIGASEVIDRPLASCGITWDLEQLQARIADARLKEGPVRLDDLAFTRPDGQRGFLGFTIIPMRDEGTSRTGALLFGSDITQRKQTEAERLQLQEELYQAQKMETVGRFAGGIAHDFNNFLQVILGFAWLIRRRHAEDQPLLNDLQEIVHSAESASALVRQLLAFGRRQALRPQVLELNQAVQAMERRLKQLVGEAIQLELQLAAEPLHVRVDPTGLEQILMNLSANARDAMPQQGTLMLTTSQCSIDAACQQTHGWAVVGEYVRLSVRDTGAGMAPEVAQHIFEPFFTTKQAGKGTGLGLAVVYGLMKQHGGLVDIETAPGQGSAFHLYFPSQAAPSIPCSQEMATEAVGAPIASSSSTKRILIVDDDHAVRLLCERVLREQYTVTSVSSAAQALDALTQQPYDLLLTDIAMPLMDGLELIERAATLRPQLKVVAMSGFLTAEMEQRLHQAPLACQVLRKPFTPAALQSSIDHQWQR